MDKSKHGSLSAVEISELLNFLLQSGKLKTIVRTGWTRFPIRDPESVADHSFRTALLAMILAPRFGFDQAKSMKMALIHDIGESITGDLVTEARTGLSELPNLQEKLDAEKKAMDSIFSGSNDKELLTLYEEFVENKSPEAHFVNQLDKLEMAIQAREYELAFPVDLGPFYKTSERKIDDPDLTRLLAEIKAYSPEIEEEK